VPCFVPFFCRGMPRHDALGARTPRNVYEDSMPSTSESGSERVPYDTASGGVGVGGGGGVSEGVAGGLGDAREQEPGGHWMVR